MTARYRAEMASYETIIEVDSPAEQVFMYLADYSNAGDWDPSVRTASAQGSGSPQMGARYSVTAGFYGRPIDLDYETIEFDAEQGRVVLESNTSSVLRRDVIVVKPRPGGGSAVAFDATVMLKGKMRLFNKGLQVAVDGIGENVATGIKKSLR